MQPDLKREGQRWWRQAERDLDDARYAFAGERYNLTGFLAQQSAEKALKAYLYSQGMEMVWGHSVRELAEMGRDAIPTYMVCPVARLSRRSVEKDGQRGLRMAARVLEAVRIRLPS